MKIFEHIFIIIIVLSLALPSKAQEVIPINTSTKINIGNYCHYYIDETNACSIYDIIQLQQKSLLKPNPETFPNYGPTQASVWLTFVLSNKTTRKRELIFEIGYPMIDSVALYYQSNNKMQVNYSGSKIPVKNWAIHNKKLAIPINLAPGETTRYFLKTNDRESLYLDLILNDTNEFAARDNLTQLFNGFVFGILFLSIIFSSVLYIGNKDTNLIIFAADNLGVVSLLLIVDGFMYYYIWPNNPEFTDIAFRIALFGTNLLGEQFSRKFVNAKKYSPVANKILILFQLLSFGGIFLSFSNESEILKFLSVIFLIGPCVELTAAINSYRKGFKPALYFIISRLPFFFITFIFGLIEYDIVPYWGPVFQFYFAAFAIFQVILISLVLAEKDYKSRVKKIEIEKETEIMKNKELAEANRFKNEILSITSHDLKGPLGNISVLSNFIVTGEESPEDVIHYAKLIRDTSAKLTILVSNLLDTAAVDLGKMSLSVKPVDVAELLREIVKHMSVTAENKNQLITYNLDHNIKHIAYIDELRIQQVLENLINNALKFSGQNTVIRLELTQDDTYICIMIIDQGPGFTEEDKQFLFQEFKKLSARPTGKESSSGLGLSIVKKIIDLHKGEITADNHAEGGAVFTILLPITPQSRNHT